MVFDGRYLDWNQKRIKGILDFYGHKFMFYKKVLDLGCGHADISGVLHRLGADITAVDARPEHLKIAQKKYSGIKILKADLDRGWPFKNQKFDIILNMDLICHLREYESHLRSVCAATTHLVLETAVCDSDDPSKNVSLLENKSIYDLSINGLGNFPTASGIEKILLECGMSFRRQDINKYNSGPYIYDWQSQNNEKCNINQRRLWYAVKHTSHIQFAEPKFPPKNIIPTNVQIQVPTQIISPVVENTNLQINTLLNDSKKRFVIVIPSYKNSDWCEKNIQSTINQNYNNYRVIFTDDNSPDDTFTKVSNIVNLSSKSNKFTLIKNTIRVGALENLYNMIYGCDDDEIILTLDGDDWLANENVLNTLNKYYSDENVWMTYGQYQNYPDGGIGIAKQIPSNIISSNSFRQYDWCASHLRTFYTWLFKKIKIEDLKYDGKFMSSAWDATIMYPQLEMSGTHSKYISDTLYIYNLDNPINDHKVDVKLQQWFDHYVRTMPKYQKCDKPQLSKTKVGLLLIATGKYDRFIQGIISSADTYFLNNSCEVTYYIFGDKQPSAHSNRNIVYIPIEHKSFPFASMDRFKHFFNNSNKFDNEDYLYYVDVDCLFVSNISKEIFGDLVGTQHCGYVNLTGPVETNPNSNFYINPNNNIYYGGGFSGGRRKNYLDLSKWCYEKIEDDLSKGIMPIWHDETAINKYFYDHNPNVILSPSYHYPQNSIERFKKIWFPQDFQPKILLLDKNHAEIRK